MWIDGLGRKADTAKRLICLFVRVNRLSNFVVSSLIVIISKFNVLVWVLLEKMTMIRLVKMYLFIKCGKCIIVLTEAWGGGATWEPRESKSAYFNGKKIIF